MKNLLLLAALAIATIEASATTTQSSQAPSSTTSPKKQRKADRQAKAPQVYKGTVAEQRRILTDAPGAESDQDNGDDTSSKSGKKSRKH